MSTSLFQDVFGALQVQSVSSGCCIGSSNWIIQSAFEKVSIYQSFRKSANGSPYVVK